MDFNPWRQSQTAIGAWYYLTEGFSLSYPVPVLGPPWSLPFEFPSYQALVAFIASTTGWPLEPCGRAVSLLAFYSLFPAVYCLLRDLFGLTHQRWFILGLFLIAPLYISLSRTFSIESLALAFSVWYLFWIYRWLVRPSLAAALSVAVLGTLASLTKITTFFAYVLATLPVLYLCGRNSLPALRSHWRHSVATAILAYVIPVGAGLFWTQYADSVKSSSALSAHLTSAEMHTWNFGTLGQRLSPETARRFELFMSNLVCSRYQILLAAIGVAISPGRWRIIFGSLILFALPPLVFTNLYFAHDYYWYANGLFVLVALGLAFAGFLETRRIPWTAGLLVCVLVGYQYRNTYLSWYGPRQTHGSSPALRLASKLNELVPAKDYCLVYGFDWDPTLAYHSRRRMIMESAAHPSVPVNAEPVASVIERAGPEGLAAIVFVGEIRANRTFVTQQLEATATAPSPAYSDDFGTIYLRRPPVQSRQQ